jgi:hypothetical protein
MAIHHRLFKAFVLVTLLVLGATGSCFAECSVQAVAATESGDGIVHIAPNGVAILGVTATLQGGPCGIRVAVNLYINPPPAGPGNLNSSICQVSTQTNTCLNNGVPNGTASVASGVDAQFTLAVFLQATGTVGEGSGACVLFFDQQTGQEVGYVCVPIESI